MNKHLNRYIVRRYSYFCFYLLFKVIFPATHNSFPEYCNNEGTFKQLGNK